MIATFAILILLTLTQLDANPKSADRKQLEITGTKGTYMFDIPTWMTVIPKKDRRVVETGDNPPSQGASYYANVAAYLTGKEKLVITPLAYIRGRSLVIVCIWAEDST